MTKLTTFFIVLRGSSFEAREKAKKNSRKPKDVTLSFGLLNRPLVRILEPRKSGSGFHMWGEWKGNA